MLRPVFEDHVLTLERDFCLKFFPLQLHFCCEFLALQLQIVHGLLLVGLHLHLHLLYFRIRLRRRWRLFAWVSKEALGVLKAERLRQLAGCVVDFRRIGNANRHSFALDLQQRHQVLNLLIFVAGAETDIDIEVELVAPLGRVNLLPAAGQANNLRLLLVLADQLQNEHEQPLESCLSKHTRNQIKPHVTAVGDNIDAGCGLVQTVASRALRVARPACSVFFPRLAILDHLVGIASIDLTLIQPANCARILDAHHATGATGQQVVQVDLTIYREIPTINLQIQVVQNGA